MLNTKLSFERKKHNTMIVLLKIYNLSLCLKVKCKGFENLIILLYSTKIHK